MTDWWWHVEAVNGHGGIQTCAVRASNVILAIEAADRAFPEGFDPCQVSVYRMGESK